MSRFASSMPCPSNVFVLAAGEQTRWRQDSNPLSVPKQLVDIAGQPLLRRLLAQVRPYGVEPVLVTHRDDLAAHAKRTFEPQGRRWTVETLYWTHPRWQADRVVVLLGDVVFSPWAMDLIMTSNTSLTVFGRQDLRFRKVGKYLEIFALSFNRLRYAEVLRGLASVIGEAGAGGPFAGKLRKFYELYDLNDNLFYPIEDWTEDIDCIEDYIIFKEVAVGRGWCHASIDW